MALDPVTHYPVPPEPRFACDLGLIANRLPDRERRIDDFFIDVAAALPDRRFLLGGAGWDDKPLPANIAYLGHVYTRDHNAFNASALAVLNVSRDSMAAYGFSPATRVFEAAGAAACIITDAWEGIAQFFEPGREILVAEDGSGGGRAARAAVRRRRPAASAPPPEPAPSPIILMRNASRCCSRYWKGIER